jgi:hypothetical protein
VPATVGTKLHVLLPSIDFESHVESRAVAVCGTKSVFVKTTVSPRATESCAGSNLKFLIAIS